MKVKPFNLIGSRWDEIVPDSLGKGWVTIKRQPTVAGLKRGGGQMVCGFSVKIETLPERVRREAVSDRSIYPL